MQHISFEDVMQLTSTVSSHSAFEDPECLAYYDILTSLDPGSVIVEVGLQFGRSSSIALQVAKAHHLRYHGIDPFIDPPNAHEEWMKLSLSIRNPETHLHVQPSAKVTCIEPIHTILIDGDHNYGFVSDDCHHFLPHVVAYGYALFHDYGSDSLPGVYKAVREYMMDHPEWMHLETIGTLSIWRRQ